MTWFRLIWKQLLNTVSCLIQSYHHKKQSHTKQPGISIMLNRRPFSKLSYMQISKFSAFLNYTLISVNEVCMNQTVECTFNHFNSNTFYFQLKLEGPNISNHIFTKWKKVASLPKNIFYEIKKKKITQMQSKQRISLKQPQGKDLISFCDDQIRRKQAAYFWYSLLNYA